MNAPSTPEIPTTVNTLRLRFEEALTPLLLLALGIDLFMPPAQFLEVFHGYTLQSWLLVLLLLALAMRVCRRVFGFMFDDEPLPVVDVIVFKLALWSPVAVLVWLAAAALQRSCL